MLRHHFSIVLMACFAMVFSPSFAAAKCAVQRVAGEEKNDIFQTVKSGQAGRSDPCSGELLSLQAWSIQACSGPRIKAPGKQAFNVDGAVGKTKSQGVKRVFKNAE